jgi:hypothetical protein
VRLRPELRSTSARRGADGDPWHRSDDRRVLARRAAQLRGRLGGDPQDPLGTTRIYDTPGHQDDFGDRSRRLQIVIGVVLLGAGLLAVILFA